MEDILVLSQGHILNRNSNGGHQLFGCIQRLFSFLEEMKIHHICFTEMKKCPIVRKYIPYLGGGGTALIVVVL